MTRDTAPIGYARYSNEFYRAAMAADDAVGEDTGFEIAAPVPVLYLIGHSIELALKSFLLFRGVSEGELRKLYGHDLQAAYDDAVKNGLHEIYAPDESEIEVLALLNALYRSKELNYIATGYKEFPVFGPLQTLSKNLMVGVSKAVGWRGKL